MRRANFTESDLPGGRLPLWAALVLVALVSIAPFLNTFGNEFTNYDEKSHILENKVIRTLTWENVLLMLNSYTPGAAPVVDYPLTHISYAINYSLHEYRPWGYHLGNLLLHTATCMLLLVLLRMGPWSRGAVLWGMLIFAVHPVHVESVTWIISRKDVLSSTLAIGAMIFYVRFIRENRVVRASVFWIFAIFLWVASVYAKPVTIIIPALLAVWILAVEPRRNRSGALLWLAPLFAIAAILTFALIQESSHRNFITQYIGGSLAMEQLTKGYMLLRYLWNLFVPHNLSAYYELRPPSGWSDYTYLCCWGGVLFLAAIFAIFARRRPAMWFYPAWFITGLLPVLHFVPFKVRMADRYLYISSVAYCLALAVSAAWLKRTLERKNKKWGTLVTAAVICIVLTYGGTSIARNTIWKNSFTLWADTARKSPDSSFVLNNYGVVHGEQGNMDEAETLYLRAIEADSGNFAPYANLGAFYKKKNDFKSAVKYFEAARKLRPYDPSIIINTAIAYIVLNRPDKAAPLLKYVLAAQPSNLDARKFLCLAFVDLKKHSEAIPHCRIYMENQPEDKRTIWTYASALFAARRLDEAAEIYSSYIQAFPDYAPAWVNIGLCYHYLGDSTRAGEMWRRALELDPDNEKALKYLNPDSPLESGRIGKSREIQGKTSEDEEAYFNGM